jgi:hypothetical protein
MACWIKTIWLRVEGTKLIPFCCYGGVGLFKAFFSFQLASRKIGVLPGLMIWTAVDTL